MTRVVVQFPAGCLAGEDDRLIVLYIHLPRTPAVGEWIEIGEDSYVVKAVTYPVTAEDDRYVCLAPVLVMGRW